MSWIHNLSKKRLFSEFGRVVFILDNVIPNPKKLYHKYRRLRLTLWEKRFLRTTWLKTDLNQEIFRTNFSKRTMEPRKNIIYHWSRKKHWKETCMKILNHSISIKVPFFLYSSVFLSGSFYSS